ncbi:MAG: HD domain-containing protein [Planctomycetaceae bacterium]|nr:HD domain-containing protein [Planctomycetaceae bacterium]
MSVATAPEPRDTSVESYSEVELRDLRVGSPLFAPIFDVRDVLLLAKGQMVTSAFLDRLQDRGIRAVRAHQRDYVRTSNAKSLSPITGATQGTATVVPPDREGYVTPSRNGMSDRLDAEICLGRLQMPKQGEPLLKRVPPRAGRRYDLGVQERLLESYHASTSQMRGVYDRLVGGDGLDRAALESLADKALSDVVGDIDLFSCVSGNPSAGDYPVRHSVNTAMLGLAIGVRTGLDVPTLRELVIGCLVHDAGMSWLDHEIYDHADDLDRTRFLEITKHPVLVFDVLKDAAVIPKRSAFIAYQMHERCDGSGYPRRRTGEQIHFLSRIAAVADAYVALVSPRAHRPAMMPYYAMEKMLRDANRGLFDTTALRGLLRTLSLFPIGSFVELSDGGIARVVRANDDYCRPAVEISGELIDLATSPLKVVKAVPAPTA